MNVLNRKYKTITNKNPANTLLIIFIKVLYPKNMYKFFTYFFFSISFLVSSEENSADVQYEDKDFVYLDNAYANLLKDFHKELILQNQDCLYLETCKDTKTKNLGEALYQKKANQLYKAKNKEQPKYPRRAVEEFIEGYVIVAFDIEIDGSTTNHRVIEGKCVEKRIKPYKDCSTFNSATLKVAKKNTYDLNTAVVIRDVPHKYTYEFDTEGKVYVDIQSRKLDRSKSFIKKKEWGKLKKLAESVDDNYIKFYWLGLASENLNDLDYALENYIKSYNLGGDPTVIEELRNRTLSLVYRMNVFKEYEYICESTYTVFDNYMCGMNLLQLGDSVGGLPYLLKAYRMNSSNKDLNQRIIEIIESQRNWIKEDLIKLQSSS